MVVKVVAVLLFLPMAYGITVAAKWSVATAGPWIAIPIIGALLAFGFWWEGRWPWPFATGTTTKRSS